MEISRNVNNISNLLIKMKKFIFNYKTKERYKTI